MGRAPPSSSYSDRHLGMPGRTRELVTLWKSKRQDIPGQARQMLAELGSSQAEQRCRVTGIDLDVMPQQPSVREYLTIWTTTR